MQRLTNLCSVLNDMEPICVLNHVFVLREYMRDCILGNFRRRLLTVLKTDNGLQRPSVVESLIRRHISIIHLAEQHISMDLTEGLREVLLMEAFTGLVSNLHNFEKPAGMQTGSAVEFICHWYMENIVKDSSGAGIVFMPMRNCFTSSQPVGEYAITDPDRCINAVIAASEFVRLERGEYQRQSTSNGHANEVLEPEILSRATVEANAKSAMQLYTKCSAVILLDSWSDSTRSNIVPKLIFMDQLCELSPYLPRSTLEMHIPYAILRSIYRQHYGNSSSMAIEILAPSPRQSPAVSLAHSSPAIRHHRGDSTPQSSTFDSSYFSSHQQEEYDVDVKAKAGDKQHRGMRSSGPLDYGSGRKVKFVEGSTSGGQGPSPLPRFAVSRSGPLLNK
ncbi:hypothetical protein J5N97_011096 [Dioscorea zingiberensis]|uniref:Uncharacterized protein n=1 Tax=Dioscorea zingiberensis TaxID=325984 RepID=A0A9D5D0D7_9LILI|nr:hypothetical protein J5N97_011096 [Dioscorea zingiberensis]